MCPDIVETKLMNQREREWKPDPQVINKWTVLYNLQKDYMQRILPQVEGMKNYDGIMQAKIIKEKNEKENLANLIQFQNKVNNDLSKRQKEDTTKFDTDKESCDDEQIKFSHNQVVGPTKPVHLSDFNKMLIGKMQQKNSNQENKSQELNESNKSALESSMKAFFTKSNGFNFAQKDNSVETENMSSPTDPKFINENMLDYNINDIAVKSNIDFSKMIGNIKLNDGEQLEYLGTSIGTPFAGINKNKFSNQLKKMSVEIGHKTIHQKTEISKYKVNHQKEQNRKEHESQKSESYSEEQNLQKTERKVQKTKEGSDKHITKKSNIITTKKPITPTQNNLKQNIGLKETKPNGNRNVDSPRFTQTKHKSMFSGDNLDSDVTESEFEQLNKDIRNPPELSSFLETRDDIRFDKNLFETLINKSQNFNLETQRRGRRRSRFPDPQWDCAETQIAKLVRYLCEEEVSSSYQKYCKPIFEQINTMIESFLYHDNNLEICQNLHMCPVTVDI